MAFWILDKKSNKADILGSMTKIVLKYEVTKSQLEYCFSQKKDLEYENDDIRIVKIDVQIIDKRQ